ncbi:MAG: SAM-dependent methyltransferase, partial [Rivularia sp. (in: cyanobacteria)]
MSKQTLRLENHIYQYLLSVSIREPEVLTKLRQETAKHPRNIMQISPEQG